MKAMKPVGRTPIGAGRDRYDGLRQMDSLVAAWDFSEPSGVPKVSKAGRGVYVLTDAGATPCVVTNDGPVSGKAISLDGIGNYLTISAANVKDLNLSKFGNGCTVLCLAQVAKQSGAQFFAGMWKESNLDPRRQYGLFYGLSFYGGAKRGCGHISRTGGASPGLPYSRDLSASKSIVPLNTWQWFGMTYNGEEIRSYYNGRFEPIPSFTEPGPPNGAGLTYSKNPYIFKEGLNNGALLSDFTVGACELTSGVSNYLQGKIAFLAVFDKALSQEEIYKVQTLLAQPSGPSLVYTFADFDTGNQPVDACGMKTYQGATAVDNSLLTTNEAGFRFVTSGAFKFLNRNNLSVGNCVVIDQQNTGVDFKDIVRLSALQNNENTADSYKFVVRVNSKWYVSETSFSQAVAGVSGSNWTSAETVSLAIAGEQWRELVINPGISMAVGSISTPSGKLEGVGFYSATQPLGNIRLRNLEVFVK